MDFDNLDNLMKYIQTNINDTLKNEVADTVKETMSHEIDDVVYDAYKPVIYKRRGLNGGLGDTNSMIDVLVSDGTLEVSNDTPFNDAYSLGDAYYYPTLTETVVYGDGYMYNNGGSYTKPRNFIESAKENLMQSGKHIEALKMGLKKRGIDNV